MQLKRSYRSFVTPALLGAGASGGTASWSSPNRTLTDARASREAPREEEVLLGLLSGPALGLLSVATGEAAPRRCVRESGELRRRIRTGQRSW
eukprot:scaffold7429_cov66-Phaeocystis_antarctica.AAC.3